MTKRTYYTFVASDGPRCECCGSKVPQKFEDVLDADYDVERQDGSVWSFTVHGWHEYEDRKKIAERYLSRFDNLKLIAMPCEDVCDEGNAYLYENRWVGGSVDVHETVKIIDKPNGKGAYPAVTIYDLVGVSPKHMWREDE